MLTIRSETTDDVAAIHAINAAAFGREQEALLVDALRTADDFLTELSLVAVDDGKAIGHILFSPIRIRTAAGVVQALALAPMAVVPERQSRGIGSKLVRHGLVECRHGGHKIVVVVGHSHYYPRFGFAPARARGLEAPFPVPDAAFMVLELQPGALDGVQGLIEYPDAFQDVS